jgi:hypothetical protein
MVDADENVTDLYTLPGCLATGGDAGDLVVAGAHTAVDGADGHAKRL